MIDQSQFLTRHRPWKQAGNRQRSFIATSENISATWQGFSRIIARIDVSSIKQVTSVRNRLTAKTEVAVSILTWDSNPDAFLRPNVPDSRHYILKRGTSVGRDYIPDYNQEALLDTSFLCFWSAPPPYGTDSITAFSYEIYAQGLALPYDSNGYVRDQEPFLDTNIDYLLYSINFPLDPDDIETDYQQLS